MVDVWSRSQIMRRFGVPSRDRGDASVRYREFLRALSTVKDMDPELVELQVRCRGGDAVTTRWCGLPDIVLSLREAAFCMFVFWPLALR